MAITATPLFAQPSDKENNKKVVTNRFLENWTLSFGAERMAFYSSAEPDGLSKSPFSGFRSTLGATASIGKWFSPELGLRTKANGYWGKRILGDNGTQNNIRFFYFQEQVMLNLTNLIYGYDPQRLYNIIPFGGVGFMRDCTHNDNSIGATIGLSNSFRLTSQLRIHFDLSAGFAGNKQKDPESLIGKYRWIGAELGLTFNLGKTSWDKSVVKRETPIYIYDEYVSLTDRKRANALTDRIVVEDDIVPSGMVLIPRGHLRMGADQMDTLFGKKTPVRDISVDDFWMDCTEVTNGQYKKFVQCVLDSIIAQRMKTPLYLDNYEKAKQSLFTTNPVTGQKDLDIRQMNYRYEVYDYTQAALRKYRKDPKERILNTDIVPDEDEQILISKDTAYVDGWGKIHRESITRPLSGSPYDFLNTYIVNIFPDTTCWVNDFPNADNEMYLRYYWSRSEYDDYPVVGVTWEQANAFCAWRTEMMKKEKGEDTIEQPFRLPTEAEWEYAARGRYQNEFPWAREFKGKGCYFANYMADEGDLTKDGNIITSRVGVYDPNSNGLYDMAGNVAEWTSTAYSEAGVEIMNVINPQLKYDAAPEDPYLMKRKTVKGGSWKDPESHIRSAWRTAEYQNQPRSYIGFRCVRSLATKASERAIAVPSQKTRKK